MALYMWQCQKCERLTRKLSDDRPQLSNCECGGENKFVTKPTSRIVEIRDNGVMPRQVEQLANVADLIKNRSTPDED